jgi:large repetitive protein
MNKNTLEMPGPGYKMMDHIEIFREFMVHFKQGGKTMKAAKRSFVALFTALVFVSVPSLAIAGDWTDKSVHDSGELNTYKRPNQKSFTGPFDYSPTDLVRPVAPAPSGKCNQFTFDATKSYDIDRQKLSVLWNFGDGTSSEEPVVTKVYEQAGDYDVTLTVKDSSGMQCDTGATSTKVTANFPPTCNAGDEKNACVGENVSFDASGSTASGPATYKWDFGDGSIAEGMQASHAYEKAGSYRVRLWIDDGKGTQCSAASCGTVVNVAERVSVALEGPEASCTGRTVSFRANGVGASNYRWDFGDGTVSESGSSVSHSYQKGGTYTVSVTADNGKGFSCSTASDSTSVKINSTPIASAGENVACCVGQSTSFDASASSDPDGDALSYHWDFGDGATSDEKSTTHVYEKSGNYRVVVTVKDESGSDCGISSDSFTAVVNTKPEAVIEVR